MINSMFTGLEAAVPLEAILGDIRRDENGTLLGAGAMIITYATDAEKETRCLDWELAYIDRMFDVQDAGTLPVDFVFYADRSMDDEVVRLVETDMPLLFTAMFVIMGYLAFAFTRCGKGSAVRSRTLLALSVFVVVVLAFLVGFAMTALVGYEINSICFMVPFIVLGVGCDDMLVVLEFFDRRGPASATAFFFL
jgi:predicted RND superfamily exporter protein